MKNKDTRNKKQLFELMSKIDNTYKPKKMLNENVNLENNLDVNEVLPSYLETALWAEESDENGLKEKTIFDVDEKSKEIARQDIIDFIKTAKEQAPDELNSYDANALGHNLWLSRNGHGVGFFDDWNDTLQNIARNMKEKNIYVGNDGFVYIS
jgi:hypothetical protein